MIAMLHIPERMAWNRPQTAEENMDKINEEKETRNLWRGLKNWFRWEGRGKGVDVLLIQFSGTECHLAMEAWWQ